MGYGVTVDGGEGQVTFRFWLLASFWISFQGFLPDNWYPAYQGSPGTHYGSRECSVSAHSGSIWWSLWNHPHDWDNSIPKWRYGNFSVKDLLLGKVDCTRGPANEEVYLLPFLEDTYQARVTGSIWHWKHRRKYARIFDIIGDRYEIDVGFYGSDGKWVDQSVPSQGKGENSWDCGDTSLGSMTLGVNTATSHYDAALLFWKHTMEHRHKHAGTNWTPGSASEVGLRSRTEAALSLPRTDLPKYLNDPDPIKRTISRYRIERTEHHEEV